MSSIYDKRKFYGGWSMLLIFTVVLVIFFSPVFNGINGLDYLDNLYNSISKGSAYYIDKIRSDESLLKSKSISVFLDTSGPEQAEQTAGLFDKAGAGASVNGTKVEVSGDLGSILATFLEDADRMYYNEGEILSEKYGYDERKVMYNIWHSLSEMDRDLKKQKLFKEAETVTLVKKKAVETAYNYYKIEPQKINDNLWIVIMSLVFYVVYTVWYGFAFMYIFEGWGLSLDH